MSSTSRPVDTGESRTPRRPVGTVAEVGEFALIDLIAQVVADAPDGSAVALGIGDDAAVIGVSDRRVVASTDLLVDTVHFRTDWSAPRDVGHRAAAANLSDIAAMGATPTALLLGLALPPETEVGWVLELVAGMAAECAPLGAAVVGGDITRSDRLTIAVTALGDLHGAAPIRRDGARPGDQVAVAGRLGWAAAGLMVLSRGFRSPRQLVEAHRRPEPPYRSAAVAVRAGVTAMVDVSDGLVADLGHIARASGVVIRLDSGILPVDPPLIDAAAAFTLDARAWVLTGGDDHALAATFPEGQVPDGFTVIGVVTEALVDVADESGGVARPGAVLIDGRPLESAGGHRHFV